jgi:uncharacterized phage infection (PIP) family protein YhgE
MRNIILIFILFISWTVIGHSQSDSLSLQEKVNLLESKLQQLDEAATQLQVEFQEGKQQRTNFQNAIYSLTKTSQDLSSQLDSLNKQLSASEATVSNLNSKISQQKEELNSQITSSQEETAQNVSALENALSKNTLYWIIAVLLVGILAIIAFYSLHGKLRENASSFSESLANTRQELEREAIRLDEKLVGVMETQMKLIEEERKAQTDVAHAEPDHSLALKVADEIVRIEKNISRMDEGTKGLKQLAKAVERIKDNFAANGYEMVDMIGKQYSEGMKVTATFRPDENLGADEKVITRIIKPQVNYKGVMIQSAQIEVSQGEKS